MNARLRQRVLRMLLACVSLPVDLRILPWIPAFLYYLWLNSVILAGVQFASPAHHSLGGLFLLAQSLALFCILITVDGLLRGTNPLRRSTSTFFFLAHLALAGLYLDVLLYRIMSLHLPRGIAIVLDGGLSQISRNWAHTGIPLRTLSTFAFAAASLVLALAFYTWAVARPSRRPGYSLPLSRAILLLAYFLLLSKIAETGGDLLWSSAFGDLQAAQPLSLSARPAIAGKAITVPPLQPGNRDGDAAPSVQFPSARPPRLPDLFLIVLESARGDFLTPEITPNLHEFSRECLQFPESYASANASHTAWYSLLSANHGLFYARAKAESVRQGSVPIRLLRRLGYKINVLCSSTLDYHEIDSISFGTGLPLCDLMIDAQKESIQTAPRRDQRVVNALLESLNQPAGGRAFFVFLHSTHHDYDWPEEDPAPFVPFAKAWNYADFGIGSRQLALIMNRYRNSLHFQDRLIGQVFTRLKDRDQYRSAIILVVGDHGEEFLEHGKLLHASNLFRPQVQVPILLRFPLGAELPLFARGSLPMAAHVDLLPTVLDYLGVRAPNSFDGQSLFRKELDLVLIAAENADRDPVRFCLQTRDHKAFFQYPSDRRPTSNQTTLFLRQVTDPHDRPSSLDLRSPAGRSFFDQHFQPALERLYPGLTNNPSTRL